jgi:RNA polymerase sigma-70 factor (ECF subfamily)
LAASQTLVRPRVHAAESAEAAEAAEGTRLLYEEYHDRIFGYCLYQLGSREEAEDATQTTFLWAFRGLRRGVVPRAEDSWLFTIAKNACRARHRARGRKRRRELISDPQVLGEISAAPSRQHDELIGLEEALARMPELQRRAILLREWRGLSYREIAAELDLSGAAVETLIFRARRSLAELLSGKPAPKRARRFAFDCGSIGLVLKGALGGISVGKVAAGLAAAVVMATAFGGSVERPLQPAKTAPQPAVETSPVAEHSGIRSSGPARKAAEDRGSRANAPAERDKRPKQPPAEQSPAEQSPTEPKVPMPSVGQQVDDTVGLLPLAPGTTDSLPLDVATDLVDDTVQTANATVQDVGETVDDVLTSLQ